MDNWISYGWEVPQLIEVTKVGMNNWSALMIEVLRLQTIKAIVNSHRFKGSSSDEPRRVQVLDLYCLTRFENEGSGRGDNLYTWTFAQNLVRQYKSRTCTLLGLSDFRLLKLRLSTIALIVWSRNIYCTLAFVKNWKSCKVLCSFITNFFVLSSCIIIPKLVRLDGHELLPWFHLIKLFWVI